jgi:hypothetical protein
MSSLIDLRDAEAIARGALFAMQIQALAINDKEDSDQINLKGSFDAINNQIISNATEENKFLALKTGQSNKSAFLAADQKSSTLEPHKNSFDRKLY